MLTALFIILMFAVFGKLILFAFKASWGILKVLLTIIIFPLFLIGLFVSGLVYIALTLLVIAGIVSVVKSLTEKLQQWMFGARHQTFITPVDFRLNLVCNQFILFGGKMFRAPHHGKPFRDGDFFMRFFWIIAQ